MDKKKELDKITAYRVNGKHTSRKETNNQIALNDISVWVNNRMKRQETRKSSVSQRSEDSKINDFFK
jgi:hypothetical protein